MYYYEVEILHCGARGYIGVGLSSQGSELKGLPGWKRGTYGYHGDDGRKFCNKYSGRGIKYGETFTTNDVIGTVNSLLINLRIS